MNTSAHVCSAIQKGLVSQRLLHADVCAASADGCSLNLKAQVDVERDYCQIIMVSKSSSLPKR
jgi:hypothetical protein